VQNKLAGDFRSASPVSLGEKYKITKRTQIRVTYWIMNELHATSFFEFVGRTDAEATRGVSNAAPFRSGQIVLEPYAKLALDTHPITIFYPKINLH
jgi:hypothetical protein